jgi:exosortase F-associated protein
MKKYWKIPILLVLLVLLVLVRMLEETLFYDPFMYFFQGCRCEDPEVFAGQWYLNVALRFLVNTLISLAIIYVVFQNINSVKFSAVLYFLLFVILFPLFIYLMEHVQKHDYLAVFYVRRFLVQPILILLLLPALYYQRLKDRKA